MVRSEIHVLYVVHRFPEVVGLSTLSFLLVSFSLLEYETVDHYRRFPFVLRPVPLSYTDTHTRTRVVRTRTHMYTRK